MTSSITELPNLPGVRRGISASNPRLYKEFMASQSQASFALNDSQAGGSYDSYEGGANNDFDLNENSLQSYFDNPEKRDHLAKTLSSYPAEGGAYNDEAGRYSLRSQQTDRTNKSRALPYSSLDNVPAFVVDKRDQCRFLAYFREKKLDGEYDRPDTKRSRKVEVVFYVEDSSIEITEPKLNNCGLMQGRVLMRHQVAKPAGVAKGDPKIIYTLNDFFAGAQLEMYNRIYYVVDCDNYTRRKMDSEGIPFGDRLPLPHDTYVTPNMRGPSRTSNAFKQKKDEKGFYEYGKKVLRFFGMWDDTCSLYGDKILVRMHYFLADDAIEVLPVHERNTGRDSVPKFLKKTKIPLSTERDAILNMNNTILQDGEPVPTYHWTDMYIGIKIPVATFEIEVLDADDFTRAFYEMKGKTLASPIRPPVVRYEIKDRPPVDTSGLIGEERVKDGLKMQTFSGIILRYVAKIMDPKPEDVQRRFIIQVHLEDDTIQIREPPIRNSGVKGGIFLSRGKVSQVRGGSPVVPTDIFLGCQIQILSHRFQVYQADEYTLKYMENHDFMWNQCHIPTVINKLKAKSEVLRRIILTTRGLSDKTVVADELEEILSAAHSGLGKQEIVTLFRSIDLATGKTGKIAVSTILKIIMK
jgi:hypothetical protein